MVSTAVPLAVNDRRHKPVSGQFRIHALNSSIKKAEIHVGSRNMKGGIRGGAGPPPPKKKKKKNQEDF